MYQLHKLRLITDWHYRSLLVDMSKRGYRTKEPRAIQAETSQVLNKVFKALRLQGIGRAEIARQLDIYPNDLDALVFGLAMLSLEGTGSGTDEPRPPALRLVKGSGD